MRREILKLSAGWVLCAAAWAAGGGENTVTNKELGFEITFPESWTVTSSPKDGPACGISPSEQRASVSVHDLRNLGLRAGISLNEYLDEWLNDHRKNSKNFEVIENIEMKFADANARKVTCTVDGTTRTIRVTHYVVVSGKRGFKVVVSGIGQETHAKEIDAIVKSFKIIETK